MLLNIIDITLFLLNTFKRRHIVEGQEHFTSDIISLNEGHLSLSFWPLSHLKSTYWIIKVVCLFSCLPHNAPVTVNVSISLSTTLNHQGHMGGNTHIPSIIIAPWTKKCRAPRVESHVSADFLGLTSNPTEYCPLK